MKRYYLAYIVFVGSFLCAFAETQDTALKSARELLKEGYQQFTSGYSDKALDTFSEVIRLDSENLDARMGQALIFAQLERHKDAFEAYDWITRRNPGNSNAWNGRGLAAFNLENFDEALASFEKSIADQPLNGFFYESIAWTQMCLGEFKKAAESAKQASLMYDRKGETSLYPLLIAFFSYHESGDSENALRTLQYASTGKSGNRWPAPVIDYLNNRINEAELISFVSNLAEETEAHTYIGLHLRLLGETEKSTSHLNWVSTHGDPQVFEYTLARALKVQADAVPARNLSSL